MAVLLFQVLRVSHGRKLEVLERKKTEADLRRTNRALQLLLRCDSAVAKATDEQVTQALQRMRKQAAVVSALAAATSKAIHIYPVAASGIDDLGEFTMRTAAEVTGGRYLFLTNDSGIGGGHAEPHIPCYYVTTLASAMRRMVATEVMGVYTAPASADILRTGGDPQNQQCTLSSGEPVTAW